MSDTLESTKSGVDTIASDVTNTKTSPSTHRRDILLILIVAVASGISTNMPSTIFERRLNSLAYGFITGLVTLIFIVGTIYRQSRFASDNEPSD